MAYSPCVDWRGRKNMEHRSRKDAMHRLSKTESIEHRSRNDAMHRLSKTKSIAHTESLALRKSVKLPALCGQLWPSAFCLLPSAFILHPSSFWFPFAVFASLR